MNNFKETLPKFIGTREELNSKGITYSIKGLGNDQTATLIYKGRRAEIKNCIFSGSVYVNGMEIREGVMAGLRHVVYSALKAN